MEFWNKKINVSKEAAQKQVSIINSFSSAKRMNIALNFANLGVNQTRAWIKKSNPNYSELELNLEFVKFMYYETNEINEEHWRFYSQVMQEKIRKDWSERFRRMMITKGWDYEDVAKLGNFKNGKVIEATISRGLPSFAKLAVMIHELNET